MVSDDTVTGFATDFEKLVSRVSTRVLDKEPEIRLTLICLLAGGHLLLEDKPGVAKTTLAKALAQVVGDATFRRIQFTADLMPSEITGVRIWNQARAVWEFTPGPVFTNVLLADEINRASPKTQAALLEAMAERQVTVTGETEPRKLPKPFLCIATQNPVDFYGTYALPEAQLDRFTMRLSLGYPGAEREADIIERHLRGAGEQKLEAPVTKERFLAMVAEARTVHMEPLLRRYIAELAAQTRGPQGRGLGVRLGVSPRGAIALAACALVRAASLGRTSATAEDVQQLAVPVLGHRLGLMNDEGTDDEGGRPLGAAVIEAAMRSLKGRRTTSSAA